MLVLVATQVAALSSKAKFLEPNLKSGQALSGASGARGVRVVWWVC